MSHTSIMYQPPSTNGTLPIRPSTRARKSKSSRSEILTRLRTSYSNAARAFLHHRTEEAHILVEEAFELLTPPSAHQNDQLSSHRRKWDILRITLETTLYTTPVDGTAAASKQAKMLESVAQSSTFKFVNPNEWSAPRSPARSTHHPFGSPSIGDPSLLSPPSLLGTLHTRSSILFAPSSDKPSSRYIPAAVLVALVLASLKLDCPQVGRGMIEDWLANRDPLGPSVDAESSGAARSGEREGYEKVVEVYCLHVLPRLNEWDYAKDFLDSEMEMTPVKRQELVATLASHHAQSLLPPSPRHTQLHNLDTSVSGSSGAPTPRAASPAPSSVSSHTAVPHTRPAAISTQVTASPVSPTSATTPRLWHQAANPVSSALLSNSIAIPPAAPALAAQPSSPPPTVLQLLKVALIPYLRRLNAPVVMLAIILSFVGLVSRFGRRPKGVGSGAEMARRRLGGGSGIWRGLVDAVRMSGRGLV
ncbi:hypothetical protein FRC06_010227 [Ceratobasidium sp. 370]|nr:hypothetical protein FRC06_010227 [Ceratobasidium sp. 370]